jgi:glutamate/tyrosine decarboxylase-like PLP-dependent enzyme/dienelactone hydrolase
VLDYALELPEIDAEAIAHFGYSLGGYLIARAAAVDDRAAALILDDGEYDFHQAYVNAVPAFLMKLVYAHRDRIPNLLAGLLARFDTQARWGLNNGVWTIGGNSYADFLRRTTKYSLKDLADRISTPALIMDAEADQFLKGQPDALATKMTAPTTMAYLTSAEGAGEHCHVGSLRPPGHLRLAQRDPHPRRHGSVAAWNRYVPEVWSAAMTQDDLLNCAQRLSRAYLAGVGERHAGGSDPSGLRRLLSDEGEDPVAVLEELAADADPGLVASAGPRYFGFVVGGSLPVALGADWLVSAWDQNAVVYSSSPAAAVAEEVAAGWALELLGLPAVASVGFVTGTQMANFSCLAAARGTLLREIGWDVEAQGLFGAPPIEVLVGDEVHVTVLRALRFLGLGQERVTRVAVDANGAVDPAALESALRTVDGPALVCAQAGNVNTGACDPLEPIADAAAAHGAWLHVDGAFGLWAAASPRFEHLVAGHARARSWATDAHKWLNVPYDCALAIVNHADALPEAMALSAAYIARSGRREPAEFVPEASRRARAIPVYAALRSLGRRGVAELVERCCAHAALMAALLREGGLEVLNEVVLNQVLVAGSPEHLARVQADGTCWLGGTSWRGHHALRVSFSSWSTTEDDVRRSARAILAAA